MVIYRLREKVWDRQVIDTTLVGGHTIQAADLNGDGVDEVITGYRGQGRSVYIYSLAGDQIKQTWTKQTLDDGGMGAAACAVADLNGDGRRDIACIDSTRLKWYENR